MTQAQMKDTRDALKFTRMCKYWSINRCHLGSDCNFAHSESELRDQPDLVSTQLCFQFARKGVCKNGEACKFAHGKSEIRRLPKNSKQNAETKKVPKPRREEGQKADSNVASIAMLSAMAAAPDTGIRLHMMSTLTLDTALTFRPPPGLEISEPASPISPAPGLGIFVPSEPIEPKLAVRLSGSSHRKPLLKQPSHDGVVNELPLYVDTKGIFAQQDVDVATESVASTLYDSDCSEPASPMSGPFWL